MLLVPFLVTLCIHAIIGVNGTGEISAYAWQDTNEGLTLPEAELAWVQARPSTAVSFSGGGSRSMIALTGHLAALRQLDLIKQIRYLCGVSGASMGTMVYMFAQTGVSDDVLLGPIIDPKHITRDNLKNMDKDCSRGAVDGDFNAEVFRSMFKIRPTTNLVYNAYKYALEKHFITAFKIPTKVPFSQDAATVAAIKSRNPAFRDVDFVLPRQASKDGGIDARPFFITNFALLGPEDMIPIKVGKRDINLVEVSPLAVGVLHSRNVTYDRKGKKYSDVVGGLIEPFAFGSEGSIPAHGLRPGQAKGELQLKPDTSLLHSTNFDLSTVLASAVWNPETYLASRTGVWTKLGLSTVDYWPPASENPAAHFHKQLPSDAGALQVDNLVSFIQRRVKSIIMVCNTASVLLPPSKWNPAKDKPASNQIDYDWSSFFGVIPDDRSSNSQTVFELDRSHVFRTDEWVPLVVKLQQALMGGRGIVVTQEHTTVQNDYFRIPAGLKIRVTWVYHSRVTAWEAQLSDEMKKLVIPEENPEDPTSVRQKGPFAHFPYYDDATSPGAASSPGGISNERANLLASMTGWVILNNAELFKKALS